MKHEPALTEEDDLRISRDLLHRMCIVYLRNKYNDESIDFSEPVPVGDIEACLSSLIGGEATTPRVWDDREWPKFVRVSVKRETT